MLFQGNFAFIFVSKPRWSDGEKKGDGEKGRRGEWGEWEMGRKRAMGRMGDGVIAGTKP